MPGQVTVYLPDVDQEDRKKRVAPRLDTLAGKTIGLLNNGWRSLDITYREFDRVLREKFEVSRVIEKRKAVPSRPMPEQDLKELIADADGVIVGLGS